MISLSQSRALSAATFLAMRGLAGAASAATALVDHVTVTWAPVSAVPISPWAMAGIALAIVAVGFGFMRGKGFARYTAYGLGAALVCVSALASRPATAALPTYSITNTTGTYTFQTNGCSFAATQFTNNAGASVNFTVIADDGANQGTRINNAQTTCAVGTPLAPAATCVVVTTGCKLS